MHIISRKCGGMVSHCNDPWDYSQMQTWRFFSPYPLCWLHCYMIKKKKSIKIKTYRCNNHLTKAAQETMTNHVIHCSHHRKPFLWILVTVTSLIKTLQTDPTFIHNCFYKGLILINKCSIEADYVCAFVWNKKWANHSSSQGG